MNSAMQKGVIVAALLFTSACSVLEPKLPEAEPGLDAEWPQLPLESSGPAIAGDELPDSVPTGWQDFFTDPVLKDLIQLALENNRDLRVAVSNVQRAQALYRVRRADRVPSLDATGTMTRGGGDNNAALFREAYSVDLGVSAFELDLFGRVRNLSQAQLRAFLAEEQAMRSTRLALVGEVANAWLTLLADRELQRLSAAALDNRQDELELEQKRFELGASSSLEVRQAEIQLETARIDVWRYAGQVAQDRNALALLTGTSLDAEQLAGPFDLDVSGPPALPSGLPSEMLLRRPDVQRAEQTLLAANASIGAARAAFFPSITLTGSIGTASDELSNLFDSGTDVWSFVPRINLPIFQGGRLRGNLAVAKADRDIALAQYERSIQSGFREVADALALTRTLQQQRASRERLLAAAAQAEFLSRQRYEAGTDSYLVLLDSQRTLYAAQQALVTTLLAQQANRVSLYKALGGGWQ